MKFRDPDFGDMYTSRVWRELRAQVLRETQYQCAMRDCLRRATVVDHKLPHRGNARLFLSRANLQALCKIHHDEKTGRSDAQRLKIG